MRPKPSVWTFLGLVWAEWASRVTGSFSATLFVLGLGISIARALGVTIPADALVQLATWTLAAVCGGHATFSVWRRERIAKDALEDRVTPRLDVAYDPNKPQCHSISEFRDNRGTKVYDGMCFRLEVTNVGRDTVTGCKAQLTEVYYNGEASEFGAMTLTWAGTLPEEILAPNIVANVSVYLDVVVITEADDMKVCSLSWPLNRQDFFSRRGTYFFTIVLSSTNSATLPPYRLRLHFDGNWKTSGIEPI